MPLIVIGTAWSLHPFNSKTGADLGFDYHPNKNARTTNDLFFAWLARFNGYIGRTLGQKVLLFSITVLSILKKKVFQALCTVGVEVLQPETTSKVQLFDAGILLLVKKRYKSRLFFIILNFGNVYR